MENGIWIIQGVLCFVFCITGLIKMLVSKEKVLKMDGPAMADLSPTQIKLAGVSELLGAIGIVLPVYLDIYPILTPLAAIGLSLSMLVALSLNNEHKLMAKVALNIVLLALSIIVAVHYLN